MMESTGIDVLLKSRYHGAANIRGVRFQLLYSLFRAFDLFEPEGPQAIGLERIEDLDLLGFRCGDLYVQAKFSAEPWNWAALKEPLAGFLGVLREDPNARFCLAVSFKLKSDLGRLAELSSLAPQDKLRLERKFFNLCREVGAATTEAATLLSRLSLTSVSDDDLWNALRRRAAQAFELGSAVVDTYLLALLGRFLSWAEEREVVTLQHIQSVRFLIAEGMERQKDFEAVGRTLIDRISWNPDGRPDDFFDGKGTRPGHVAMGLDVRRARWLERIDEAVSGAGACVVRSSSGQGKSALVYRYAFENWPREHTFLLRACATAEDAEKIGEHLRFRANAGLPTFIVIEDAGWRVPSWPIVVRECAALQIPVVAAVRHEDWYRFSQGSTTRFKVVEPGLDLGEAKEIFSRSAQTGRIHAAVPSAEWAFEKIGDPALLMEYVYLLTHGRMLEERLREQVRRFGDQGEDPKKVELLRRVATAHAAGVPLSIEKLVESLDMRDDPQHVLKSITDEYVSLSGELVTGLHWVRSKHLFELLHNGYPSKTKTLLGVAPLVPENELATFIAGAMLMENVDLAALLAGLARKLASKPLSTISACLDGVFRGGEQRFVRSSRGVFDKAREILGRSGTLLAATDLLPSMRVDLLKQFGGMGLPGEHKRDQLRSVLSEAVDTPRGTHFLAEFLRDASAWLPPEPLNTPSKMLGRFLEWCAFCGFELPAWREARNRPPAEDVPFSLEVEDFCLWLLGLYRYDEETYHDWFGRNRERLIGYLMFHLELTSLRIDDARNEVSIQFLVDGEGDAHARMMERLEKVRAAIPSCGRYCSDGIWVVPFGLKPSIDPTQKRIPAENFPQDVDVQRNMVFHKAVEDAYRSDSYFEFQRYWVGARKSTLEFLRSFTQWLQRFLESRNVPRRWSEKTALLGVTLHEALRWPQDPPFQASQQVQEMFRSDARGWATSLENFVGQILSYVSDQEDRTGRLALHNLRDAQKRLPAMHEAFRVLFRESMDYNDAESLVQKESSLYGPLIDLVDCWVNFRPTGPRPNIFSLIRARRKGEWADQLGGLKDVQTALAGHGVRIELPTAAYFDAPLTYLGIVVHVNDPLTAFEAVAVVASLLAPLQDVVHFYCLVPVCNGARWIEEGYVFSTDTITGIVEGTLKTWESLVPREIPQGVLATLPAYPVVPTRDPKSLFVGENQALLMALASIPELWRYVEPFKEADCPFRRALFGRLCRKVEERVEVCRRLASGLAQRLGELQSETSTPEERDVLSRLYADVLRIDGIETALDVAARNGISNEALSAGDVGGAVSEISDS